MSYWHIGLCHFCEHHGPNVMFQSRVVELRRRSEIRKSVEVESSSPARYKQWSCVACYPLEQGHPGYVTYFDEKRVAVISSDKPETPFYRRLHQACFQSLSSEVSPSKDSFLFFTDPGNAVSVASFTFVLKDSTARGFRRLYSIIYLNSDQSNLLSVFPFLETEIKKLAAELQDMAAKVYSKEELICSQKALRTAVQLSSIGTARALQDLIQSPDIFACLHARFSEMLRISRNSVIQVQGTLADENFLSKEDIPALKDVVSLLDAADLRLLVHHLLRGGGYQLQTDNLLQSERISIALNMLVPKFGCPEDTKDIVALNLHGDKLSMQILHKEEPSKGSRLVSRFEKILLLDEVPDSIVLQQLQSVHQEMAEAVLMYSRLKLSEPAKVLQFFNVLGYTAEDILLFKHWSEK